MSKRGSYNGGNSVKNTMTFDKKAYLDERIRQREKDKQTQKEKFQRSLDEWYVNPPPDKLIKRNIE